VRHEPISTNIELTEHTDAPGATYLAYTPNGKKLVTTGTDNYCRVFTTGSDDEPNTIDNCQEDNTAVVAGVRAYF
jgi:chromosome transmission fidelity protein 4